jgi:hypothetical protein
MFIRSTALRCAVKGVLVNGLAIGAIYAPIKHKRPKLGRFNGVIIHDTGYRLLTKRNARVRFWLDERPPVRIATS